MYMPTTCRTGGFMLCPPCETGITALLQQLTKLTATMATTPLTVVRLLGLGMPIVYSKAAARLARPDQYSLKAKARVTARHHETSTHDPGSPLMLGRRLV